MGEESLGILDFYFWKYDNIQNKSRMLLFFGVQLTAHVLYIPKYLDLVHDSSIQFILQDYYLDGDTQLDKSRCQYIAFSENA